MQSGNIAAPFWSRMWLRSHSSRWQGKTSNKTNRSQLTESEAKHRPSKLFCIMTFGRHNDGRESTPRTKPGPAFGGGKLGSGLAFAAMGFFSDWPGVAALNLFALAHEWHSHIKFKKMKHNTVTTNGTCDCRELTLEENLKQFKAKALPFQELQP